MVWSSTPMGYVISSSLDNAFVTTWVMASLYTTVKSYSKNNNNHLVILFKIVVCWPNKPMPYIYIKDKFITQQIMCKLEQNKNHC
jgi:hypothetical protein